MTANRNKITNNIKAYAVQHHGTPPFNPSNETVSPNSNSNNTSTQASNTKATVNTNNDQERPQEDDDNENKSNNSEELIAMETDQPQVFANPTKIKVIESQVNLKFVY